MGHQAEAALKALRGRPRHGRRLSAAAETLATPSPGLTEVEVTAGLASTDPRRRRVSVRALGYSRDPDRLRRLVDALGDADLIVRLEAQGAIRRLAASLDPLVRDVAFAASLQHLHARAAGSRLLTAEGIVLEAAGRPGARDALRRAAANPGRILAPLHLVDLETDPERRWVALTQAAHRVMAAVHDRLGALDRARTKGPVDVALLRQCAGLDRVLQQVLARTAGIAKARAQATGQKRSRAAPLGRRRPAGSRRASTGCAPTPRPGRGSSTGATWPSAWTRAPAGGRRRRRRRWRRWRSSPGRPGCRGPRRPRARRPEPAGQVAAAARGGARGRGEAGAGDHGEGPPGAKTAERAR